MFGGETFLKDEADGNMVRFSEEKDARDDENEYGEPTDKWTRHKLFAQEKWSIDCKSVSVKILVNPPNIFSRLIKETKPPHFKNGLWNK